MLSADVATCSLMNRACHHHRLHRCSPREAAGKIRPMMRTAPVYRHILVATDGSELSERAIRQAVALAQALQAKVTALHIIKPWRTVAPGEIMVAFPESEYRKGAEIAAQKYLDVALDAARERNVPCDARSVEHPHPWQAILSTAEAAGCDLIVMASHGRKGLQALLIGSETKKVLAHSKLPVLICR